MTYTSDQIALAIIAEGQTARTSGTPETLHPVISPRGIQIALSTSIVETNEQDLANPNVPESENYPNDGDGTDHLSAGEFQQQYMWWGTVAEEMDPHLSAAMFYHHLAGMNYNDPNTSPGTFAQDVQQSAFPDRYDQKFGAAVDQYNRLAGGAIPLPTPPVVATVPAPKFSETNGIDGFNNFSDRQSKNVDLLLIHTEEPKLAPYARDAQSLYDFCKSTTGERAVSYHYSISQDANGNVSVWDMVDTDYECWAVLDSNPDSINYCFANSSVDLSTQEWMDQFGNAIDVCAYLIVQDARKYNVPIKFLFPDPNDNSVYPGPPPGISDHKYVTDFLGDGTHIDVGGNFPWTYLKQRILYYTSNQTEDNFMANVSDADAALLVAAAKKMLATDMPGNQWPSRGMFVGSAGGVDDTVGEILNIDGNVWNLEVIIGVLLGVPDDVQLIRDAADGNFPLDSYVNGNAWLAARATSFAKALLPLVGLLPKLLKAASAPQPVATPALDPAHQPPMNPTYRKTRP